MTFIARDGHLISSAEAESWIREAEKSLEQNDLEEALALYRKALSWYQTAMPRALSADGIASCYLGEGYCLAGIAAVQADRGAWDEARRFYQNARLKFANVHQLEDEADAMLMLDFAETEAVVLRNLALAQGHLKKYAESLEAADAARDLFRALEDVRGESDALMLSGYACLDLGRRKEAVERLETAATLARQASDTKLEARIEADLARERGRR
jgi:tetratricopeptide (TPR) repeat protein